MTNALPLRHPPLPTSAAFTRRSEDWLKSDAFKLDDAAGSGVGATFWWRGSGGASTSDDHGEIRMSHLRLCGSVVDARSTKALEAFNRRVALRCQAVFSARNPPREVACPHAWNDTKTSVATGSN